MIKAFKKRFTPGVVLTIMVVVSLVLTYITVKESRSWYYKQEVYTSTYVDFNNILASDTHCPNGKTMITDILAKNGKITHYDNYKIEKKFKECAKNNPTSIKDLKKSILSKV